MGTAKHQRRVNRLNENLAVRWRGSNLTGYR